MARKQWVLMDDKGRVVDKGARRWVLERAEAWARLAPHVRWEVRTVIGSIWEGGIYGPPIWTWEPGEKGGDQRWVQLTTPSTV